MPYRILFSRFSIVVYAIVGVVGLAAMMVTAVIKNPGPDGTSTATLTSIFGFSTLIIQQLFSHLRSESERMKSDEARREIKETAVQAVAAASDAKEKAAETREVVQQVMQKVEENTAITERGFYETNNYKQREQQWLEMFARIASPAERQQMEQIQTTGEDTNRRVQEVQEKADEVADALRQKESGQ
jgi:hypothetical protein